MRESSPVMAALPLDSPREDVLHTGTQLGPTPDHTAAVLVGLSVSAQAPATASR